MQQAEDDYKGKFVVLFQHVLQLPVISLVKRHAGLDIHLLCTFLSKFITMICMPSSAFWSTSKLSLYNQLQFCDMHNCVIHVCICVGWVSPRECSRKTELSGTFSNSPEHALFTNHDSGRMMQKLLMHNHSLIRPQQVHASMQCMWHILRSWFCKVGRCGFLVCCSP